MKKLLAAIVTLSFILAAVPPAFADEPVEELSTETVEDSPTESIEELSTESVEELPEEKSESSSKKPFRKPNISYKWINLYVDEALIHMTNRVMYIDENLYVPAEDTALLLSMKVSHDPFSDTITALHLSHDDSNVYLFENSYYAIINSTALNLKHPCYDIDGVLYAPLDILSETFGIELYLDTQGPDTDIHLTSFISETGALYAKRINSLNIKSDTDYLIWVCKADYAVRLFRKASGVWVFEKEFPCAIGAPSTPTCEGTYKFYERVKAWYYTDYYVGPVMRFNGGYALHSTILNYDGTPKNDRVQAKISHGCVRLHAEDINYLYNTIPLYTTVYVTAD